MKAVSRTFHLGVVPVRMSGFWMGGSFVDYFLPLLEPFLAVLEGFLGFRLFRSLIGAEGQC